MVSYAPNVLRCGIAQGTVLSVGDGEDYVGSSINIAARLQKMPGVDIAFSGMGFLPERTWSKAAMARWVLVKVEIRGIGNGELIYIRREAYDELGSEDKKIYLEP
jgi:hypothetical protein